MPKQLKFEREPYVQNKHVTAHYGPTLHNRYYGKTQAARAAHPGQRLLTEEQERSAEEWVEKRDALGYPFEPKELQKMIVLDKYSTTTRKALAASEWGITAPAAS